jgi:hypothetical protein
MLTVVLPPGETSPVHRHNADVFVYVLSGVVVMLVKGRARNASCRPDLLRSAERYPGRRQQRQQDQARQIHRPRQGQGRADGRVRSLEGQAPASPQALTMVDAFTREAIDVDQGSRIRGRHEAAELEL